MGFFRNELGDITTGPEVLHHVFGALSKVMHLAIDCGRGSGPSSTQILVHTSR